MLFQMVVVEDVVLYAEIMLILSLLVQVVVREMVQDMAITIFMEVLDLITVQDRTEVVLQDIWEKVVHYLQEEQEDQEGLRAV